MDAPTYPAAERFIAPRRVARIMTTANASLADLMAIPEVWAAVVEALPMVKMATSSSMIQPHLGNMSLHDLAGFTPTAGGKRRADGRSDLDVQLDALDARLKALGPR